LGKGFSKSLGVQPRVRGYALASVSLIPLFVLGIVGAKAQPVGGSVVAGQAQISTAGSATLINQSTAKAIINWQDFSVAKGGSVQFNQPSSSSLTLNRVTGGSISDIEGSIRANGQVWLLNPNGLLFGNGAQINVGGLLATTSDLANQDFLAGRYNFTGGNGSVVNNGAIKAGKGGVVLSAPTVVNNGIIAAKAGHVVLGGTDTFTVDFDGDHLISYAVGDSKKSGTVVNTGKIKAGDVLLTAKAAQGVQDAVVNNSGMVEATSAKVENGEVVLEADGGAATNSGTLDAKGKKDGETGGTVKVLGDQVAVTDGAQIDVSGNAGGGTVLIGGNFKGQGPEKNAQNTTIGTATIKANALKTGNGGKVAVWSDGTTKVAATITARGKSGTGGQVETSGHDLSVTGVSVEAGVGGNWLLDPNDLTVDAAAAASINTSLGAGTGVLLETTSGTATGPGIQTAGGAGDIFINAPISWSTGAILTLSAFHNVNINADISVTGNGTLVIPSPLSGTGDYTFIGGHRINFGSTDNGGALTIGGVSYTLLYTMNDVQGLDSLPSGHVALATSLDATGFSNWRPLGADSSGTPIGTVNGYTGVFEGLGNTISNLTINQGNNPNQGLFGVLGGTVRDFGMVGGSVTGGTGGNIGGLAGNAASTSVLLNVFSTATVNGGDTNGVGGLVGSGAGTITNAYAGGNVTITGGGDFPCCVGGLIGGNSGTITNSYATGNVNTGSQAHYAGGLAGINSAGGTITNSYATGTVTTGGQGGGLAGGNSGTIINSYFDTDTSGIGSGGAVGDEEGAASNVTGLTTAQLASVLPTGFSSPWVNGLSTPYLSTIGGGAVYAASDSTHLLPLIFSMSQLQAVNNNLNGNYALGASLDATGVTGWAALGTDGNGAAINSNNGFTGIFDGLGHTISNLTINNTNLQGLFGAATNATIRNLGLVNESVTGTVNVGGLIGSMSGATSLTNDFVSGAITGTEDVGGLVGYAAAATTTIANSHTDGLVTLTGAMGYAGGLVGVASGSITGSYSTSIVQGGASTQGLGGLAGVSQSTVSNSYATGAVTGGSLVGGLVGEMTSGTLSNSYAMGAVLRSGGTGANFGGLVGQVDSGTINAVFATGVVAGANTGALVGQNGGTVTNGYWDTVTSGNTASTGIGSVSGSGVTTGTMGLTTAQLQGTLTNAVGFSMSSWGTGTGLYPYLTAIYSAAPTAIIGHVSASGAVASSAAGAITVSALGGGVMASGTTDTTGHYYLLLPSAAASTGVLTYINNSGSFKPGTYVGASYFATPVTSALSFTSEGQFQTTGNYTSLSQILNGISTAIGTYAPTGDTGFTPVTGIAPATISKGNGAAGLQVSFSSTNSGSFSFDAPLTIADDGTFTLQTFGAINQTGGSALTADTVSLLVANSGGITGSGGSGGNAFVVNANSGPLNLSAETLGSGTLSLASSSDVNLAAGVAGVSGDFSLETTGNIVVTGAVQTSSSNVLLKADNAIDIQAPVSDTGGTVFLWAGANPSNGIAGAVTDTGQSAVTAASVKIRNDKGGTSDQTIGSAGLPLLVNASQLDTYTADDDIYISAQSGGYTLADLFGNSATMQGAGDTVLRPAGSLAQTAPLNMDGGLTVVTQGSGSAGTIALTNTGNVVPGALHFYTDTGAGVSYASASSSFGVVLGQSQVGGDLDVEAIGGGLGITVTGADDTAVEAAGRLTLHADGDISRDPMAGGINLYGSQVSLHSEIGRIGDNSDVPVIVHADTFAAKTGGGDLFLDLTNYTMGGGTVALGTLTNALNGDVVSGISLGTPATTGFAGMPLGSASIGMLDHGGVPNLIGGAAPVIANGLTISGGPGITLTNSANAIYGPIGLDASIISLTNSVETVIDHLDLDGQNAAQSITMRVTDPSTLTQPGIVLLHDIQADPTTGLVDIQAAGNIGAVSNGDNIPYIFGATVKLASMSGQIGAPPSDFNMLPNLGSYSATSLAVNAGALSAVTGNNGDINLSLQGFPLATDPSGQDYLSIGDGTHGISAGSGNVTLSLTDTALTQTQAITANSLSINLSCSDFCAGQGSLDVVLGNPGNAVSTFGVSAPYNTAGNVTFADSVNLSLQGVAAPGYSSGNSDEIQVNGDVNISTTGTLTLNSPVSGTDSVTLHADQGIFSQNFGASTISVGSGGKVLLSATNGGIGTSDSPLYVETSTILASSGNGGVTLTLSTPDGHALAVGDGSTALAPDGTVTPDASVPTGIYAPGSPVALVVNNAGIDNSIGSPIVASTLFVSAQDPFFDSSCVGVDCPSETLYDINLANPGNAITGGISLFADGQVTLSNSVDTILSQVGTPYGGFPPGVVEGPSGLSVTAGDDTHVASINLAGDVQVLGDIFLSASNSITQASTASIIQQYDNGYAAFDLSAAAGGISLTSATNSITGEFFVQAPGDISLTNTADFYIHSIFGSTSSMGEGVHNPANSVTLVALGSSIQQDQGTPGITARSISLTTTGADMGCDDCELFLSGGPDAMGNPNVAPFSLALNTGGGSAYLESFSPVTVANLGANNGISLGGGSLYLTAGGDVTVNAPITSSNGTVNLDAQGSIQVNAAITADDPGNSGAGTIMLTANDACVVYDCGTNSDTGGIFTNGTALLSAATMIFNVQAGPDGLSGGIGAPSAPLLINSYNSSSISLSADTYAGDVYLSSATGVSFDAPSQGRSIDLTAPDALDQYGNPMRGSLLLVANGPITESSGIAVKDLNIATAVPGASITLETAPSCSDCNDGNTVTGIARFNTQGGDVTFASAATLRLGASSVNGNLEIDAFDPVNANAQILIADPNGGVVHVTGATNLYADADIVQGQGFDRELGFDDRNAIALETGALDVENGGEILFAQAANKITGQISLATATDPILYNSVDTSLGTIQVLGNLDVESAGALTVNSLVFADGTINLAARGGDLTLGTAAYLSSAGASGDTIVLAASGNFLNNASYGSQVLGAGDGNSWKIYSAAPTGDVFGGLDSVNTAIWNMSFATPTAAAGNRYVFAFQPTLTVSANSISKIYGTDASAALQQPVTVSGLQPGVAGAYMGDDASIYSGTPVLASAGAAAGAAVGSYAITVDTSNFANSAGYAIATQAGSMVTVNPATLLYTADAISRIYGGANPVLTGSVTGFVNGDTLASATSGTLAFATNVTAASPVGAYAINGSGLTADNYVFAQASGNAAALTINPATLLYTANASSRTYGSANPVLTGMVTGFVNGDTLASATNGTLAFATNATAASPVGAYAINGAGLNAGNYVFAQAAGNAAALTINPATLVYVANSASRSAGSANPAFSGNVTGFVNNDSQASATSGILRFTSLADATSPAGSYAVNGSGLQAANYVFTQAAGNATALTVTAAPPPPTPAITDAQTAAIITTVTTALQVPQNLPPKTTPPADSAPPPPAPPPPPPSAPPAPPPPSQTSADSGGDTDPPTSSDQATSSVASSLDGSAAADSGGGGTVIPKMLVTTPAPPSGTLSDATALPSFGNTSLWQ
jgi:filamentous hemagglutinin family protein